jgi:hypothetical protein
MEKEFKVGDMVVLVKGYPSYHLKAGAYGRVVERYCCRGEPINNDMPLIEIFNWTGGHDGGDEDGSTNKLRVHLDRIVPVKELPKGTRVRYIGDNCAPVLPKKHTGTVDSGVSPTFDVIWDGLTDGHSGNTSGETRSHSFVRLDDLEVIGFEEPKASKATPKFKKGDRVRTVCDSFDLPAGSIGTVYGYLGGNGFDVAFDDNTDGHCGLAEDDSTNHRYLDEGQLELLKEDTMTDNISNNPFVIKETIITRRIDYSHVFKDERGVVVAGPAYPGIMLFPNDLRGEYCISSSEVVELRDYLTAYIEAKEITDTK